MRGGRRKGAGRKSPYKEPTKGICITVPISQIEPVKTLVKTYLKDYEHKN